MSLTEKSIVTLIYDVINTNQRNIYKNKNLTVKYNWTTYFDTTVN